MNCLLKAIELSVVQFSFYMKGKFDVLFTRVNVIWFYCYTSLQDVISVHWHILFDIENCLFPMRRFHTRRSGKSNWFMALNETNLEPSDQSVQIIRSSDV